MLQESQIIDGNNLVHSAYERRKAKVQAMIDVCQTRDAICIERNPPAVPENVKVAIRNKYTATPNIASGRKRMLLCVNSACNQRVLFNRLPFHHTRPQPSYR